MNYKIYSKGSISIYEILDTELIPIKTIYCINAKIVKYNTEITTI